MVRHIIHQWTFSYRDDGAHIAVWGLDNTVYGFGDEYRNNLGEFKWDLAGQIGLTLNARADNLGLFALAHDLPESEPTVPLNDSSPILGDELTYSGWTDSGAWYRGVGADGMIAGYSRLETDFYNTNVVTGLNGTPLPYSRVDVVSIEQEWSDMFAGWALDGFDDSSAGFARQDFMAEWVPRVTNTSYMRGELGWDVLVVPVEAANGIDTTPFTANFQIDYLDIYNANSMGNGTTGWNNNEHNLFSDEDDYLLVPVNQAELVQQIGAGLSVGGGLDFGPYQESLSYRVDVRYNVNTGQVGYFLVVDHNSVIDVDAEAGLSLDVDLGLIWANDTWGMNPGAISYSTNIIGSVEALYFGGSYYQTIGSDGQSGLQMSDAEGAFIGIGDPDLGINAGLNTEAVIYLGSNPGEIASNIPQILDSVINASATIISEQPILTTQEGASGDVPIDPIDLALIRPVTYTIESNGSVTLNYSLNYAPTQEVLASAAVFFAPGVDLPPGSTFITQPIIINSDGNIMGYVDANGNLVNFDYPESSMGPILPAGSQILPVGRTAITPDGRIYTQLADGTLVEATPPPPF
jgi:hypothetical protein